MGGGFVGIDGRLCHRIEKAGEIFGVPKAPWRLLLVAAWAFSVAATKRKAGRRETLAPTISLPINILLLLTNGQAKAGINPRTPKKG